MTRRTLLWTSLLLWLAQSATAQLATLEIEAPSPAIADGKLVQGVGVEIPDGGFAALLAAGCALPCESTTLFSTSADGQTEIGVTLFRGPGDKIADATRLGNFIVTGVPAAPQGEAKVAVSLKAADGVLSITAIERTGAPIGLERKTE